MKLFNILASATIAIGLTASVSGVASAATNTFNFSGAIFDYTVPVTGLYDLSALGAQGGSYVISVLTNKSGGLGAQVDGKVTLTKNDVLHFLVGAQGGSGLAAGGGGGATYVYDGANLLMVAGGGGGAGTTAHGGVGLTTNTGTSGGVGSRSGGGGGLVDNGGNGSNVFLVGRATGGKSYANGGAGGVGKGFGGNGGFGGGGGASATAGGGGGGYNGGAGAAALGGGLGGGSYYDVGLISSPVETSGFRSGDGLVSLTLLSAAPEPAAWALMMVGVGGMGAALRTRRRKAVVA